ncbi:hypothetical protein AB6A40_000535 [Gnathostoma spinigerum]|uniref:Uncharacterized protein n=1 Tax=Gnathostoma spinigerum TaxID=75299 RepID=A0ABD6E8Z3_9BILA
MTDTVRQWLLSTIEGRGFWMKLGSCQSQLNVPLRPSLSLPSHHISKLYSSLSSALSSRLPFHLTISASITSLPSLSHEAAT